MKMEPIVSSETSAIRTQTPGNYPKRNKLHLEHGESLKTSLKISRQRKGTEGPNCGVRESRSTVNFCMSWFVYVEDGLRWRDFMLVWQTMFLCHDWRRTDLWCNVDCPGALTAWSYARKRCDITTNWTHWKVSVLVMFCGILRKVCAQVWLLCCCGFADYCSLFF